MFNGNKGVEVLSTNSAKGGKTRSTHMKMITTAAERNKGVKP